MIIRSYRRALRIQRRVHQIPMSPTKNWAIPYPNGIAIRTVAYFVCLAVAMAFISHLVFLGAVVQVIPAGGRYIVIPAVLTWLMVSQTFDGRTPHRWLWSALRFALRAKRTSAGRKVPERVSWSGKVSVAHDEFSPELHKARIYGPSVVRFNVPVLTKWGWRRNLVATGNEGGRRSVCVVADRLDVRA